MNRSTLGSAEGRLHDLIGRRCGFILGKLRLLSERALQDLVEAVKGIEVAFVAGLDRFLDAMVARDEDGVRPPHQGNGLAAVGIAQARAPIAQPGDDRIGLVEQMGDGFVVATFQRIGKMAEYQREVGLAIGHRSEQAFHQVPVVGLAGFDADLCGESCLQVGLVNFGRRHRGTIRRRQSIVSDRRRAEAAEFPRSGSSSRGRSGPDWQRRNVLGDRSS